MDRRLIGPSLDFLNLMARPQMQIVKVVKYWLIQKDFFPIVNLHVYGASIFVTDIIDMKFDFDGDVWITESRKSYGYHRENYDRLNYHDPDFLQKLENSIKNIMARAWVREQCGKVD